MATSTAPIGQSLFDFLDGKTGLEQLEVLKSGALGREINRYVQTQLEQFNIGSIQDSIQNSIWGNHSWNANHEAGNAARPLAFNDDTPGARPIDLVGDNCTRISGAEDLGTGLGGIDTALNNPEQATEQIFRTHRDA
jgi:hypothetical protein